jgi:hypothetical protein
MDSRDIRALVDGLNKLVDVQKKIADRMDWLVKEVRASNQIKKEEKEDE